MRRRATRLAALTAKVAADSGADLIAASRISVGHDVCSAAPWAWGFAPADQRARGDVVGFHPRPEATGAIAQAIVALLRR